MGLYGVHWIEGRINVFVLIGKLDDNSTIITRKVLRTFKSAMLIVGFGPVILSKTSSLKITNVIAHSRGWPS